MVSFLANMSLSLLKLLLLVFVWTFDLIMAWMFRLKCVVSSCITDSIVNIWVNDIPSSCVPYHTVGRLCNGYLQRGWKYFEKRLEFVSSTLENRWNVIYCVYAEQMSGNPLKYSQFSICTECYLTCISGTLLQSASFMHSYCFLITF